MNITKLAGNTDHPALLRQFNEIRGIFLQWSDLPAHSVVALEAFTWVRISRISQVMAPRRDISGQGLTFYDTITAIDARGARCNVVFHMSHGLR